jgi:hypothetical protein
MNTEEKEIEKQDLKSEDALAKIAISREADRALMEVLDRVADGFEAGKATKQDLASYLILRFSKDCAESEIHGIRALFFNPILLMEATLKKAKETGILPDSIKNLFFDQFMESQSQPAAKRIKKVLRSNNIKDNVLPDSEAA